MGSNITLTWKLGRDSWMRESIVAASRNAAWLRSEGAQALLPGQQQAMQAYQGQAPPGRDNALFISAIPCLALEF